MTKAFASLDANHDGYIQEGEFVDFVNGAAATKKEAAPLDPPAIRKKSALHILEATPVTSDWRLRQTISLLVLQWLPQIASQYAVVSCAVICIPQKRHTQVLQMSKAPHQLQPASKK